MIPKQASNFGSVLTFQSPLKYKMIQPTGYEQSGINIVEMGRQFFKIHSEIQDSVLCRDRELTALFNARSIVVHTIFIDSPICKEGDRDSGTHLAGVFQLKLG